MALSGEAAKKDIHRIVFTPWWVDEATEQVAQHLSETKHPRVLELGVSFATPWLAMRCRELTTFEPSERWASAMRACLDTKQLSHIAEVIHDPNASRSSAFNFALSRFIGRKRAYQVGTLTLYEDRSSPKFHLIVAHGKGRVQCAQKAIRDKLLAPGGIFLLDHGEDLRYRKGVVALMAAGLSPSEYVKQAHHGESLPPHTTMLFRKVVAKDRHFISVIRKPPPPNP